MSLIGNKMTSRKTPAWISSVVIFVCIASTYAWNPDAGVIESYTKLPGVTATATSGSNAAKVLDGDDNTSWISSFCLPQGYFNRNDVNVLKGVCSNGHCTSSSNATSSELGKATDGNVYTVGHVTASLDRGVTKSRLTILLTPATSLQVITVNAVFHDNSTVLKVTRQNNGRTVREVLRTFQTTDSYKSIQIFDSGASISQLEFVSDASFSVKEIAAIGPKGCIETVSVDLGFPRRIGTIKTRHWAGSNAATSLALKTSVNGLTWSSVAMLEPDALHSVITTMTPSEARYIALEYQVQLRNYQKVYCFEIDAWDEYGIWGPKISPKPQRKTMRELLGVNGIWGWGHNKYSGSLGPGQGPFLYNAISSHGRNYHNLNWDVTDPDNDPGYANMANGKGTQAKWWLNWDNEYSAWKAANLSVDASVQFTNKTFPQRLWNDPAQASFNYGKEFAKHFGSALGNGLIDAVEIGNEPWDYNASFYATVLQGMTDGVRSVDRGITVLPGAFQAEDKHETGTYIGTRVLPGVAGNIDVINCHTYSFLNDDNGVRRGVFPEHKQSTFNNIRPITRWRDANVPGKPVWVTEWGWDSAGEGEPCSFSECVSEQAQAVYGIRGLAIMSRSCIERATWFFYANLDNNSLFGRSGLTASHHKNFTKKTVFVAFEELLSRMGESYFLGVLREDDGAYIYLYSKSQHQLTGTENSADLLSMTSHILAWLPADISDGRSEQVTVTLPSSVRPSRGWRFVCVSKTQTSEALSDIDFHGHVLNLHLSVFPTLIELETRQTVVPVG